MRENERVISVVDLNSDTLLKMAIRSARDILLAISLYYGVLLLQSCCPSGESYKLLSRSSIHDKLTTGQPTLYNVDEIAVKIVGNKDQADRLARKYGFVNYGEVCAEVTEYFQRVDCMY